MESIKESLTILKDLHKEIFHRKGSRNISKTKRILKNIKESSKYPKES